IYIPSFAKVGADIITVHYEATPHIHRAIQMIKKEGKKAGVVINPGTPAEVLQPILGDVDLILLMTVNPGFGGQQFIHSVLPKIKQVADWKNQHQLNYEIE